MTGLQKAFKEVAAKFTLGDIYEGSPSGYMKGAVISDIKLEQCVGGAARICVYARGSSFMRKDAWLNVKVFEQRTDVSFFDLDRSNEDVEKEIAALSSADFEAIGWSDIT